MRMHRCALVLLTATSLLATGGCEKPESKAVRDADARCDAAIEARDGEAYVKLMSKDSMALCDRLVKLAREANRVKADALPYSEKAMLLELRHRAPAGELRKMDARSYLIHAVRNGWWETTEATGGKRGRVVLKKNSAKLYIKYDGEESPDPFCFVLEDGEWKIDMPAGLAETDKLMPAVLRDEGMTENNYIFSQLEEDSGREVKPSVWDPPQ